jgi:hypothetical protein
MQQHQYTRKSSRPAGAAKAAVIIFACLIVGVMLAVAMLAKF